MFGAEMSWSPMTIIVLWVSARTASSQLKGVASSSFSFSTRTGKFSGRGARRLSSRMTRRRQRFQAILVIAPPAVAVATAWAMSACLNGFDMRGRLAASGGISA